MQNVRPCSHQKQLSTQLTFHLSYSYVLIQMNFNATLKYLVFKMCPSDEDVAVAHIHYALLHLRHKKQQKKKNNNMGASVLFNIR